MKPQTVPVMKVTGAFLNLETATDAVRNLRKVGYRSGQIRILRHLLPSQLLKNLPHPVFARYLRQLAGATYIFVCVSARNIDDAQAVLQNGGAQVAHNRYFANPVADDKPRGIDRPMSFKRWRE